MLKDYLNIDVLCVGHACFDLIFSVDHHLGPDEKGIAEGKKWNELLQYSSAVAALCCTKLGARLGIPTGKEVKTFLEKQG